MTTGGWKEALLHLSEGTAERVSCHPDSKSEAGRWRPWKAALLPKRDGLRVPQPFCILSRRSRLKYITAETLQSRKDEAPA